MRLHLSSMNRPILIAIALLLQAAIACAQQEMRLAAAISLKEAIADCASRSKRKRTSREILIRRQR